MPLVEVTYAPDIAESMLRELGAVLPHLVSEASGPQPGSARSASTYRSRWLRGRRVSESHRPPRSARGCGRPLPFRHG
ncbi:hypothetical protein [Nocardia sp. CA-290969]|uniref:hypothetical protein n=1 Tax=Nocardia sp. CA-290969 TaxID=3239986 RepID=UPI003D8B19A9